jgi:transcriptional regulator with XRE-family HTH domain
MTLNGSQPRTQALLADLRALIQAGGYSQSEIARALGTTRQKVNSWFREKRPHAPGLEDGLAIADLIRRETRKAKRRAKRAQANS